MGSSLGNREPHLGFRLTQLEGCWVMVYAYTDEDGLASDSGHSGVLLQRTQRNFEY